MTLSLNICRRKEGCSNLLEEVLDHVRVGIKQIERLFTEYGDLLRHLQQEQPNQVELMAAASILHSFYNGLEITFRSVAKNLDGKIPSGSDWHHELLNQMARATEKRPALLSAQSPAILKEYLDFRHFFRHAYSFSLDWNRCGNLIQTLPEVWAQVRNDFGTFIEAFESFQE